MNLSCSTKCCSRKYIILFQAKIDKKIYLHEGLSINLDLKSISYGMLKGTSPNYIENNQVIKENFFGNINDLSKLRDSFNFLTSNSYFSIYPDLFSDFDMHKIPFEISNHVASKLHFYEISNSVDSLIKHEYERLRHILLLDHHPIQSFKKNEDLLQDNYSQPIFDEINTSTFIETKNVCSHQNHLYEKSNFIGENKIFVVEFSITCDHQNLASSSIDSPLAIDPINKITSFDIRSLPVYSPITSFHDPILYLKPILSNVSVTNAYNLICPFESPKIGLPRMDFIFLDHTLHSKFHDKIAEWLENYYLKRFSEKW